MSSGRKNDSIEAERLRIYWCVSCAAPKTSELKFSRVRKLLASSTSLAVASSLLVVEVANISCISLNDGLIRSTNITSGRDSVSLASKSRYRPLREGSSASGRHDSTTFYLWRANRLENTGDGGARPEARSVHSTASGALK